ncbi:MAG: thioredoxin domain-containing protein [Propionibacteriales bacterium]|nr:thioredoxin domain-containing protein [Propionibacteriales bacterium]
MATKNLTAADFEKTIADNDIVLVDFWADWCGPCVRFAPVYEAASEKHPDLVFGKVDTEAERELAGAARIMSIPTLMIFREGILVFAQPGALPASALEDLIGAVRAADMDDIRAQIAEQEKGEVPEKVESSS